MEKESMRCRVPEITEEDETVRAGVPISLDSTVASEKAISTQDTALPEEISTTATMAAGKASEGSGWPENGSGRGDLDELPTIDPALYSRGAEIARGGMGRIIKARDRKLGALVHGSPPPSVDRSNPASRGQVKTGQSLQDGIL
jgi:hypothetical protein